jgi:hypothetical protein
VKTALVIHGPSVWKDLRGELIYEDALEVVVRIDSRDDAGIYTYDVRMPRDCVKIEPLLLTG